MADATEAAETEVVDPAIAAPDATVVAQPEPATEDDIEKQLATLKQQLDSEKQARETERQGRVEAEKRAFQAQNDTRGAALAAEDANLQMVITAISSIEQKNAVHKANFRAAMAAGDFDAAAEAQEGMSNNAAELLQLRTGKQALEQRIDQAKKAPTPVQHADPVEQFASGLSAPSAQWVRAHPQAVTDIRLQRRMVRAHGDALDEGIPADTPEYFAFVEGRLGIGQTTPKPNDVAVDTDNPMSSAAAPTVRRTPPAAAPVSRSMSTSGQRQGTIRLSAEEAEIAEMSGLTPEQYWKNKQELKAAQRLN